MHLTDEPNKPDLDNYVRLSEFVRENNYGIKTLDAMSHYELAEKKAVTLPVVSMNSAEFDKFSGADRMVYYCIGVDESLFSYAASENGSPRHATLRHKRKGIFAVGI